MLEMTHGEEIKDAKDRLNRSPWNIEPWMGMVRASFGIYNKKDEVDYFIKSLQDILDNKEYYKTQYSAIENGDYSHKSFHFSSKQYFTLSDFINEDLSNV